jgi:hypothetical protein
LISIKNPLIEGVLIRGKKVVFQNLASVGASGIGKNSITSLALVFANAIKGIKNGRVRINNLKKRLVKKGRGVGIPPFLTPKP